MAKKVNRKEKESRKVRKKVSLLTDISSQQTEIRGRGARHWTNIQKLVPRVIFIIFRSSLHDIQCFMQVKHGFNF